MVVALIEFRAPVSDPDRTNALYKETADRYTAVPGLIRKYYLHSEDGAIGGGVYLFESKEAAEGLFTPEWHRYFRERYGQDAQIRYFRCPVVVDNAIHQIITADGIQNVGS